MKIWKYGRMEVKMKAIFNSKASAAVLGLLFISGFIVPVSADMPPPPTNRLDVGGNYQIGPPPSNFMFQVTDNPTNAGDDNLVWSHSGRMLAVDRSDPSVSPPNKYVCLLDIRNLGNIQVLGARSSAATNPLYCNITGWTWNDDRVLFGWQPQVGSPPHEGICRLMSCTTTGPTNVALFLESSPAGNPTNHLYSPSVLYDEYAGKERLLFLCSSAPNTPTEPGPGQRINLYTVTYDSGGTPNWSDRVQLTAFNTNLAIQSVKWCPELGTNYQPICNRLEILLTFPQMGGPIRQQGGENSRIIIFNNVREVIANPATAPVSISDPHFFMVLETNMLMDSQVSWTFDGQYVMYGRNSTNPPPPIKQQGEPASDLYSKKTDNPTNPAVKFEVPSSIQGGKKQWLCISPDGMKAAFTVNHKVFVIPMQFDNVAVTNQVPGQTTTNILTDASYTMVDVPGTAIDSNTTFQIVAPPSVDTNNFNGEFSGYARQFTVPGVSSQFNLNTNAEMTLHFSESDIPAGASATNLAVYVYNPQGTNAGQTGTWDKLDSVINTNLMTITCTAQHFSVYAIGRASAQTENPPVAPSGVSATKGTYQEKVSVTWTAAGNATSYQVWRNTVNDSSSAVKFSTEPTAANYDDTSATAGTLYYYWVKSKNASGVSSFSSYDTGYAMGVHSAYAADFDGDRKADPTVYYEGINTWGVKLSGSGYSPAINLLNYLGGPGYVGLGADFDGDAYADPAVYKAASGTWLVKLSASGYQILTLANFLGDSYKTAVAADFDGDRLADPAVYEASTGTWLVKLSSSGYTTLTLTAFLGESSCTALAADFDGDRLADPAIYKEATGVWTIKLSSAQYAPISITLGGYGYKALAGDIDGDGLADPAVFQPTTGNWILELSGSGYAQLPLNGFLGGL
jgi:hypothetical protein